MGIADYSTTAGSNTSINGINIAEGWPAANINNAFRQMMADIASDAVTKTGTQTLTNKTLTSPTVNTPTIDSPTFTNTTLDVASGGTGANTEADARTALDVYSTGDVDGAFFSIAQTRASVNDFMLTLVTGTPIMTTEVTGATTIYFTPYKGNSIALIKSGVGWVVYESAEMSKALGTLTSGKIYDVFCYEDSDVPTLEFLAWTNGTARATTLTLVDGIPTKTGDDTRRYVGSFKTTSTTETEFSKTKMYVWNETNKVCRYLHKTISTASYNYTTATWRQAEGSTANQVDFIVGRAGECIEAYLGAGASNTSATVPLGVAIGYDQRDSSYPAQVRPSMVTQVANVNVAGSAFIKLHPSEGEHYLAWLEFSTATGTTSWKSADTNGGLIASIMA